MGRRFPVVEGLCAWTDSRLVSSGAARYPRALGWSVTVVFLGSLLAVAVMPSAQGRTGAEDPGQGQVAAPPASDPGTTAGPAPAVVAVPTTDPTASPGATPATSAPAAPAAPVSTVKKPAATAAKAAAAPTAPTSTTTAAARLQPDAGSYALRLSGSSTVDGKTTPLPASGSLVVRQLSATDQSQQTTGLPGDLVLVQRASAAGVDLVSFSLTASGKTLTFSPPAPVAFVRTDAAVGASWTWSVRSTDGTVSVSQTASVTSVGPVSVAGASVPAVTVQRVLTVTGSVQGTLRLTSTVSLSDRLPLVQHQALDVKATALGLLSTRIVSDATATLTSTRP